MSYENKLLFLGRIKEEFQDILTGNQEVQVLSIISKHLDNFKIEQKVFSNEEDDLVQIYLDALEVQGLSQKTILRYGYEINRLLKYSKTLVREVSIYHLRDYFSKEKARGVSSRTMEGNRQVYSAFFNWIHREGLISKNPMANFKPIKCAKKVKTVYTDIDIERLKQSCDNIRNKAIVCFLYSSGCRVSELTGLNTDDVDLNNLECVVHGKGDKERTVYLDAITGMSLRQYLNERKDDNEALFVSLKNPENRLNPNGVRAMLKNLEKKCGVVHVHPHKFRTTRASLLAKHGMPVQEIAAVLGHEKLDTTMKYVIIDKRDIKNSYQKFA